MDRIQSLEIFVAVAEAESFSGGARVVGISAPTATRGVTELEERLGARLFTRTTRQVRLTDVGAVYLEEARQILAHLQAADDVASGAATNPKGHLRITSPNEFGRIYVTKLVMEFLDTYPDVTAEVFMVDRVVNIVEEGFDIAVRIGDLPSSGLSAVKVGQVRRVVCGSENYFAKYGVPKTPADLTDHRLVSALPVTPIGEWRFGTQSQQSIKVASRLKLSSVAASIDVVREGWGLCRVLSYQIGPDLADGTLRTVLEDYEPATLPVHLVHVEGRRATAKVRSFIDFSKARLQKIPVLN